MNLLKRFFQEDIPATFSAGKLRINLIQFKGRYSQLEKQKTTLLAELGKKAWAGKIKNDSYAVTYKKLEELDGLVASAQKEMDAIQDKIKQETGSLNATKAEFDSRLKAVQEQRQQSLEKLAKLHEAQKNIEQRASQLKVVLTQSTTNLQNLSAQIIQIQASDLVDKEAKIASLKNTVISVQAQKDEVLAKINVVKEEHESNQAEQTPVKNEIEGYNQQIAALQEQNKLAVQPIQEQLKRLQQELVKANEKKTGILNQINALMPEFGGQVYKYRPVSDLLTTEYGKLDVLQNDIKVALDQINLTEARLSSVNSGSVQKVAIIGGVLVLLILSIIVIAVWVVPTVITLLTPDAKSNIQLVQSWTLENCGLQGQSDGLYYDISVWENRRNNAVANVEKETKLLGANAIVLNSRSDELKIAPGGMVVSMVALDSKGSRVQETKNTVNSVYFAETSLNGQNNNPTVQMYFEKSQYSNNVSLALEIINKSDFGLSGSGNIYAVVVNKQNKVIDILTGSMNERNIKIDSLSKVTFQSLNSYNTSSCLQADYTQDEVTFWYFVPLTIATDANVQMMVSGKAVYKP